MADKKKFSKSPKNKKKFEFVGLEPKMKYKGDPYESIKDTDTEVDMKNMAAVFSKGDDDGFMDDKASAKTAKK
jgi:protein subunit release factor B